MPGDNWRKFANLRLLYSYMYAHPGKKLLFMGAEFAQGVEWNHEQSLDWHLLQYSNHRGVQTLIKDLNAIYLAESALHLYDFDPQGFEWIHCGDWEGSILSFIRNGKFPSETILAVSNFTPVTRQRYRIGVPAAGFWREIFNSDATEYGGSGQGNQGGRQSEPIPCHGRKHSLNLTIPPLATVYLKNVNQPKSI